MKIYKEINSLIKHLKNLNTTYTIPGKTYLILYSIMCGFEK